MLLHAQKDNKLQLDRFILPDDDGTYAFLITPGTYVIAGFEDTNKNRRHDPGEPAGAWGSPDKTMVAGKYEAESDKKVLAESPDPKRFQI